MFPNRTDLDLFDLLDKQGIADYVTDIVNYKGEEIGGFYTSDKVLTLLDNCADKKEDFLTFKKEDWDRIQAHNHLCIGLFHTHIKDTQDWRLSYDDICLARKLNIPICTYHTVFKKWDFYSPRIPHPYPLRLNKNSSIRQIQWYTGWEYCPGRADCYSIIEYFYQAAGIILPSLGRSVDDFGKERNKNWNRFLSEANANGFSLLCEEKPQPRDVVLLRLDGSIYPNHCGVCLDDEIFLHLLGGKRKSEFLELKRYMNAITAFYRFTGL